MVERRDMPLFAWGEALRAARRRRMLARRAAMVALCCACVSATIVVPPAPRLVWNASASAPLGLYRVVPGTALARGDMVVARTPLSVRALAARRRYVPANVPLVKRVAALTGDRACAAGTLVAITGGLAVRRHFADRLGRPLPWWGGCRTLGSGEIFLLMPDAADSFDGRYFGPSPAADVIGKAVPLWVW